VPCGWGSGTEHPGRAALPPTDSGRRERVVALRSRGRVRRVSGGVQSAKRHNDVGVVGLGERLTAKLSPRRRSPRASVVTLRRRPDRGARTSAVGDRWWLHLEALIRHAALCQGRGSCPDRVSAAGVAGWLRTYLDPLPAAP